jgi:hypothetical protein
MYHYCRATLGQAEKAAAPAFEKACQIIGIAGDE